MSTRIVCSIPDQTESEKIYHHRNKMVKHQRSKLEVQRLVKAAERLEEIPVQQNKS